MRETTTRNTIFSSLALSFALTLVIWLTAGNLANRFDVVNEKYFTFFYPWQTHSPTIMAYVTAWVGLNVVVRIPFIEFSLVGILYLLYLTINGLTKLLPSITVTPAQAGD